MCAAIVGTVSSDFEFLALSFKCPARSLECARSSSSLLSFVSMCVSFYTFGRHEKGPEVIAASCV